MALWEAIVTKALDLVETALRKVSPIAALDHALDHHRLIEFNGPHAPKGGHSLAQAVGLIAGKARRLHGNAHGLFLKQRHAQRLAQHPFELIGRTVVGMGRGKGHRLAPGPAVEIGMDHIALNRSGTDNGHLNDQIIETDRLEARQHAHLRPALDLKDPDRIGLTEHLIDRRILARHGGEAKVAAIGIADQIKAPANGAEHAQGQHIDLHHLEGVNIVLVPLDKGAGRHRRIADGHGLDQIAAREDEAADML